MKRKFIAIVYIMLILLLLSGCISGEEPITKIGNMKTICLDGVTYYCFTESVGYQGYGFMSVKFNKDGTVHTCGE